MDQQICPACKIASASTNYFCPNCGHKLKDRPLSTSILRQIFIYSISFVIPPSGFWYGIKYIRQGGRTKNTIGIIAIVLTMLSTIISIIAFKAGIDYVNKTLNDQLNQYNNLTL